MKKILFFVIMSLGLFADDFSKAVEDYKNGSYIQALNAFYVLAKEGDAKAQYNVGMMYANGLGGRKDRKEAKLWYEKAAKKGIASAQYNLALLLQNSAEKTGHAYEKAKYWYEKAAESGVMQAYNNLGILYMEGRGTPTDVQKAFDLFKKAAEKGDANAQVNVGVLYAWGEGVTHDKMKAYENFKKALQLGKSEASEYLDRLCKESSWVCQ